MLEGGMNYPNYNFNYNQYQQIQNGGFVTVQSEMEARCYPVKHGTSVMFRDENSPYIYSKTLGFGQLDIPTFEKYRLIKEENAEISPNKSDPINSPSYITKGEFEPFCDELKALREKVDSLRKELGDEHI